MSITPKPEFRTIDPANGAAPRQRERRSVGYVDGRFDVPIFRREDLKAGHRIDGPAVIEEPASVTVIGPGQDVRVGVFGQLHIATTT